MIEKKYSVPSKPTKESLLIQYSALARQQDGISKETSIWKKVRDEKREVAYQLALVGFDVHTMKDIKPHIPSKV